ncbi:thioesterase family protein [Mycobacterium sp. IDR2000157661]|uniref:thioesterase family protein n=1 Tax=Mycobacterium sp. IDR2000157661 TaxID=2867005 RepID=UPI001EEA6F9C|nr:thioesterase family protein [Mycobacterium sp. IDR2000157661]ULE34203.1 thioesterase family protein [Mycobacterium sp. IDR2000157661]
MSGSTLFTDAMALTTTGDGVYHGELNEHWTIGPKVHGGAMLALCANAARLEHGGDVEPIAVSGNFLWAPDPGPMQVVTTVRKRGRRVSLIDVELRQGVRAGDVGAPPARRAGGRSREEQKVAVRASITLGEPEHHVPPLLSVNPVIPLMQPDPPPGLEPIGPGHRMADVVHLAHGCDIRPSLTTMEPRTDGGPPVIEYWVRPKGTPPDVLFALLCGDVSAPVTFGVNRFGWAPTVQLTAYLRSLPADGWLRVLCTTVQIGQDWFDEDHIVVDCEGHIVVQSRQLAMVPTG